MNRDQNSDLIKQTSDTRCQTLSSEQNFGGPSSRDEAAQRSVLMLGSKGLRQLRKARIALLGLGGVGGAAAEALSRCQIGKLLIIDPDVVSPSNLNRQIISSQENIGQSKCALWQSRIHSIDPEIEVETKAIFIDGQSDLSFLNDYDYVLDCIDTVTAKIRLALHCHEMHIPFISCMGTARKSDPTRLRVLDLFETQGDPLCKVMRRELRKRGLNQLKIVASDEAPQGLSPTHFPGEKRLGSMIFVPASAGLLLAKTVIDDLAPTLSEEEAESCYDLSL